MTSSLIDFYLFSFLPTDPTSFLWCSAEQEINLVWPQQDKLWWDWVTKLDVCEPYVKLFDHAHFINTTPNLISLSCIILSPCRHSNKCKTTGCHIAGLESGFYNLFRTDHYYHQDFAM